jgi:Tol biopolymer transport system component
MSRSQFARGIAALARRSYGWPIVPIRIWLAVAVTALASAASPLGAAGAASASVSAPANGLIAFVSATNDDEFNDFAAGIGVASADGSGRRLVTHDVPGVGQPAWSPDGRIALVYGSSIALVNADGSGLRTIPRPADAVDRSPAWSPTGRLAFIRTEIGGVDTTLMLADSEGQHQRTLLLGRSLRGSPVWSRDGREVELLSGTGRGGRLATVVDIAASTYTIRKLPRVCADVPIPAPRDARAVCLGADAKGTLSRLWLLRPHHADLIAQGRGAIGRPAWRPDGTRVAYAGNFGSVFVRVLATNRSVNFGADTGEVNPTAPRRVGYAPDGRHIVVGTDSGPAWQIGILNTRSANVRTLIGHTHDVNPRWSPDGQMLAYVHLTGYGYGDLRVQPVAGTSWAVARELYPPRVGWEYAWSPDSRALAFVSGTGDLWSVDADGSGSRKIGYGVDSSPAWSPDGSTVAVTTVDYLTGEHRIAFIGADGSSSPLTPPPVGATAAVWSPDGMSLFYLDESGGHGTSVASLWIPSTRQARVLMPLHVALAGAFSIDGARVYLELQEQGFIEGLIVDVGDPGEAAGGGAGLGTWSPDGALLAAERYGGVEIRPAPHPGDGDWLGGVEIPDAHDPSWQAAP